MFMIMDFFTRAVNVLKTLVKALESKGIPWEPAKQKRKPKRFKISQTQMNLPAVIKAGRRYIRPPIRAEPAGE